MKHLSWSVLVALCLGGFPVFAQETTKEKHKKVRFGVELRGTVFGVPHHIPRITNVPEGLRQVPGHKEDFSDSNVTITVPDASINPQRFVNLAVAAAPGITFSERVSVRFGAHWGIPLFQTAQPRNGGNTREINLGGTTDRGVGSSLVYYSAQYSAARHPGPFGEVELRISKRYSVLAGYLVNYYDLTIERGWDRFNALERSDRRHLASARMHAPYAGFRVFDDAQKSDWFGVVVFAGLANTQLTPGPLAGGANIEMNKRGILLGVSVGKTFRFKRKKTS